MKYFIKTFGCQQNVADSERIAQAFESRGMSIAQNEHDANYVVINTCMVRASAEHRVYGLVRNLAVIKTQKNQTGEVYKIIVTGCMVGMAFRDKSGAFLNRLRTLMPEVDEFMPIEEVGFDYIPVRSSSTRAWVPISNGCNNFCTFCIVPFTRGREISRPYADIIKECKDLAAKGVTHITLLGQNVNSYGADLIMGKENIQVMRDIDTHYFTQNPHTENNSQNGFSHLTTLRGTLTYNGRTIEPVYVKHLGRYRIPTLFPYLLEDVARLGFEEVQFISSNPWDFSDELINVIAENENIARVIHLPLQSGSNSVLRRMNRWYTADEYFQIIQKLKSKVPDITFTTDIIVGFCGESDAEFEETKILASRIGFKNAYIAMYSVRPMTAATKVFQDDIPHVVKKDRWKQLEFLINKFTH